MYQSSSHVTFGLVLALAVLAIPVIAAWRKGLDPRWLGFMAAASIALAVGMVKAQKPDPLALMMNPMLIGLPAAMPDMPSLGDIPQIDPNDLLKQLQP